LTVMVPAGLHRLLRMSSADKGKTMSEIAVESLVIHLKEYEKI
jgi:hypothetical protein